MNFLELVDKMRQELSEFQIKLNIKVLVRSDIQFQKLLLHNHPKNFSKRRLSLHLIVRSVFTDSSNTISMMIVTPTRASSPCYYKHRVAILKLSNK